MSRRTLLIVVGTLGVVAAIAGFVATGGGRAHPPEPVASGAAPEGLGDAATDRPPVVERRFVAARARLRDHPDPGPLALWHGDALSRELAGVTDRREQMDIRSRLSRELGRRKNAIWEEGHMERAGKAALVIARLRFEIARTTGDAPAPAYPFELALRWNRAEAISGVDAYREPMRAAAELCGRHDDAAGRLGELAQACLGVTDGY